MAQDLYRHHRDRGNVLMLASLCLVPVLVLSPTHVFAVMDDGLYASAVRYYQHTGTYVAHDWAAVSLVAQVVWGALFADLFGFSITVLTWSTLVLSGAGVLCSYWLLRLLRLPSGTALFGALLVLANPVYLHLSYSFMTDVPAFSCTLAALCFMVWGLQTQRDRRLLIGALFCTIAVLIRQTDVFVSVALVLYLSFAHRLTVRRIALGAVPIATLLGYQLWETLTGAGAVPEQYLAIPGVAGSGPLLIAAHVGLGLIRLLLVAPAMAFWILPLFPFVLPVRMGPKHLMTAMQVAALMIAAYWLIDGFGRTPFDQTRGVFDSTGFVILAGDPSTISPILNPAFWTGFSLILIGVTAWFAVYWGSMLVGQLRMLLARRPRCVPSFVTCAGLCAAIGTIATPRMYDRYLLILFPFVLIVLLRRFTSFVFGFRLAAFVLLGILLAFSVTCQADYVDHATAHWQAGEALLAQGAPWYEIDAGFEWERAYYYDSAGYLRLNPAHPNFEVGQPAAFAYAVSDRTLPGYHIVGQVPYFSRLGGFTWRASYLLARDGVVGGTR